MNKLNLHPSTLIQPVEARSEFRTLQQNPVNASRKQHRLLVLVPADLDYSAMTRQIWELANSTHASVQLLSLCKDVDEPGLRRGLATMCALMRDGGVSAETKVEISANWVEAVKRNQQKGDLIVCFAEQRTGLLQRPLSQILQSNLDVQLYILSGLNALDLPRPTWLSQIMAWAGSVGIIVGAFLLQIRITLLPQDWVQTTLLLLSVAAEIWSIWAWNNLFG